MKKIAALAGILALVSAGALSAHQDKAQMDAMKAEFAKCMMCKDFLPVFDQLMPVMQHEIVKLDNGMAMVCTVTDAQKVKLLHDVNAKMGASADACMKLSDADAQKQLCPMCQGIRSASKAGAVVSSGPTKTGTLLVLTSNDPKVQTQISALQQQCATMMAESSH